MIFEISISSGAAPLRPCCPGLPDLVPREMFRGEGRECIQCMPSTVEKLLRLCNIQTRKQKQSRETHIELKVKQCNLQRLSCKSAGIKAGISQKISPLTRNCVGIALLILRVRSCSSSLFALPTNSLNSLQVFPVGPIPTQKERQSQCCRHHNYLLLRKEENNTCRNKSRQHKEK